MDIKQIVNKNNKSNPSADFVSLLFEIEVNTHILHLQAKARGSFAIHTALDPLYQDIVGWRDKFVESYQGKYGIITGYKTIPITSMSPKEYVASKAIEVEMYRTKFTEGYLQQIIDSIIELHYSTKYKLDNLE